MNAININHSQTTHHSTVPQVEPLMLKIMAPAFSKEAILVGAVDYLCLVCEGYFTNENDVAAHIPKLSHKKNLEATQYEATFTGDQIRKVKKWYFCEFCNTVLSTKTKVSLHVGESKHKENKFSNIIVREEDFIIFADKIAINDESWHSFTKDTCLLCDVEFDDKETHKIEATHVIKLIQSNVSDVDNNIYRKINDSTFHCLTCNEIFIDISAHFDDTKHKDILQKCFKVPLPKQEKKLMNECMKNKENGNKKDTVDAKLVDVKNNADENIKKNNEVTSKPATKVNVKFDEHICEALGAKDYMVNCENDEMLCILCDLSVSKCKVKTHVDGLHHQTLLGMHERRGKELTTATNDTDNILDLIPKFEKNHININLEYNTAVCRQCSKDLEFKSQVIEKHIEDHIKNKQNKKVPKNSATPINDENGKKMDNKTLFSSPVSLSQTRKDESKAAADLKTTKQTKDSDKETKKAKEELVHSSPSNPVPETNGTKGEGLSKSPTPKTVKETKGNKTEKVDLKKKCDFKKIQTCHFIKTLANTITNGEFFIDSIMNEQYCISYFSFLFLTLVDGMSFRCHLCEVSKLQSEVQKHLETEKHTMGLRDALVIVHPDSEFIREIRPESFHCGFCNIVKCSWQDMDRHLNSTNHKENKTCCAWRAKQSLQEIKHNNLPVEYSIEFPMRFMN